MVENQKIYCISIEVPLINILIFYEAILTATAVTNSSKAIISSSISSSIKSSTNKTTGETKITLKD